MRAPRGLELPHGRGKAGHRFAQRPELLAYLLRSEHRYRRVERRIFASSGKSGGRGSPSKLITGSVRLTTASSKVQVLQRRAIGTLMAGLSTGLARQLGFVLPLPDRHPPAQNARHHRATQAAKQCGDYCGRNRVHIPEHTEAGAAGTVRSCDPRASRHPGSGSGRYSASITSCHAPKSNHSTRLRYVLLELWKLGRERGPRFLAKPRFDFSVVSRLT